MLKIELSQFADEDAMPLLDSVEPENAANRTSIAGHYPSIFLSVISLTRSPCGASLPMVKWTRRSNSRTPTGDLGGRWKSKQSAKAGDRRRTQPGPATSAAHGEALSRLQTRRQHQRGSGGPCLRPDRCRPGTAIGLSASVRPDASLIRHRGYPTSAPESSPFPCRRRCTSR